MAVLVSREGVANRHAPSTEPLMPAELAAMAQADRFDEAIQAAVADSLAVPEASEWATLKVEPGQTLSNLFDSQRLPPEEWMAVLALGGDALQLKRMKAGEELQLRKNGAQLEELRYALDELRTLHIRRVGDDLEADTLTAALERRDAQLTGAIRSSLFMDGLKAGMTNRMVMELADIFGYDIDFALDLREGDRFAVVYEQLYKDGEKLRNGDILAAEFVNQGKVYRAVRNIDKEGRSAYYTPEGQSLRKAFIRTPLDFARISSPFNLKRRHPILNTIRAHKGVDYAASSGTPIKAAGDGKVTFVGVKNGYGKVIVLQHGSQYQTLYAHMSRYKPGITTGSHVSQGQVIGYVGATGLATAPHLHFEFRVNGNHVNPVTVALPRANPLTRTELANFKAQTTPLVAQLDSVTKTYTASAATTAGNGSAAATAAK